MDVAAPYRGKMKVATCRHKEQIEADEGIEIGTCDICHQVTQYGPGLLGRVSVLTKLGRIDGRVVLPSPKKRLLLSKEDKRDLRAATQRRLNEREKNTP